MKDEKKEVENKTTKINPVVGLEIVKRQIRNLKVLVERDLKGLIGKIIGKEIEGLVVKSIASNQRAPVVIGIN